MKEYDFLCELRHTGVHKNLPPLFMLKKAAENILLFFYKDYWFPKYQSIMKDKQGL